MRGILGRLRKAFARGGRRPASPRGRQPFRPRLEALEERWCPTAHYIWTGDSPFGNDWTKSGNWRSNDGGTTYPSSGDYATFDGNEASAQGCVIGDADITVKSIDTVSNWGGGANQTVTINAAKTLTINGGVTIDSSWDSGALDIKGGLVMSYGTLTVTGGSFTDSSATGTGTVTVSNAGTVHWGGSASTLAPALTVSTGTFNLGGGGNNLTSGTNLVVSKNITVGAGGGTFNLNQTANEATSGGIRRATGTTPKFVNHGTLARGTGGSAHAFVNLKIENDGVVSIPVSSGLKADDPDGTDDYYQTGGETKLYQNATLQVPGRAFFTSGDLYCVEASANATMTVDGELYFNSNDGNIYLGLYSAATKYVTLQVTGDCTTSSGVTTWFTVNGASQTECDQIVVGPGHYGSFAGTCKIYCVTQAPTGTMLNVYKLLDTSNTLSVSWSVTHEGDARPGGWTEYLINSQQDYVTDPV